MDRRQPLKVGEEEWRMVRQRLWSDEDPTEVIMPKIEETTDNLLTKLIASPYTGWVVGGVAVLILVLFLFGYFK